MVGPRSLSVPFTYDLISSAAPAIVINGMAVGVNHLAPNFPARVSSARNMCSGNRQYCVGTPANATVRWWAGAGGDITIN